jgi:hydroxymethylpyrimidine/phosphomethylpyrimidine kinase
MIATSGARLLERDAIRVLHELIPLADVLTPNLPEAEALLGIEIKNARGAERAAHALLDLGAGAVLLKGGHARGREVLDLYADSRGTLELRHPRLDIQAHGTGCTLSAALAAHLAKRATPRTAARRATDFVQRALRGSFRPGGGALHVLHHP